MPSPDLAAGWSVAVGVGDQVVDQGSQCEAVTAHRAAFAVQFDVLAAAFEISVARGDRGARQFGEVERRHVGPIVLGFHAIEQQNLGDQVFEACHLVADYKKAKRPHGQCCAFASWRMPNYQTLLQPAMSLFFLIGTSTRAAPLYWR